jgi:dynein light intermediate chain 1, cytosolic
VKDDAEEGEPFILFLDRPGFETFFRPDTLARLSVYIVPSSASSYTALLPHFLPPRTALSHSLAIITLDWTKPWTFVEELQKWLKWIDKWTTGDGSREVDMVREETHNRRKA